MKQKTNTHTKPMKTTKFLTSTSAFILGSIFATGLLAPAASAATFNLVGTTEGELNVGVASPDDYIDSHFLIKSIKSLVDSSSGEKSLLYVDNLDTLSKYRGDKIEFLTTDAGTNQGGYWFRPVEATEEKGQLEVGTFEFTFSQMIDELTIQAYDVESHETGILSINGENINEYFLKAKNNAIQTKTFEDVESIVLKLGKDNPKPGKTGDGVSFRMTAMVNNPIDVPEPSVVLGLGAIAASGLGLRKRKS
ncbi:MAG: LEVG family PEP-CTERM protein [Trichodesmium sp.]